MTTTTKQPKAAKAAAPKKGKKLPNIESYIEQLFEEEGEDGGKIVMILKLYIKGYSRKEIIQAGFNKVTVYRQTREYEKMKAAPQLEYYGYEVFEGRVQRLMKAKGLTREQAVETLMAKDLEG